MAEVDADDGVRIVALVATISVTLSADQSPPRRLAGHMASARAPTLLGALVTTYCVTCHNSRVKPPAALDN
jgi:hypothetical protein